jgi:deoxyribonuclease IV
LSESVSSQRFKERIQLTRGRHEHISKGYIGVEAFRLLLNDKRFWGLPMCLETPKGPDLKEDKENLNTAKELG